MREIPREELGRIVGVFPQLLTLNLAANLIPKSRYLSEVFVFVSQFVLAVCCSVLQCVAVCCSVLQCVAVCCSVLYVSEMCVLTSLSLNMYI